MKLEYLWADFERIALGLKKSRLDSSNTFTYELHRKDENGANQIIYKGRLLNDTTITDSGGLSQEKSYRYRFLGYTDSTKILDTAVTLTAKVLSPTGHSFIWEVDTIGTEGWINDLWGFNENNVWGVGAVQLPGGASNVIYWNGSGWEIVPSNLQFYLYGIYGFSANQIWVVGNGNYNWGGVAFWNGTSFTEYKFDADKPEYADTIYALNAVWGSAPDDVWAVGQRGTIIHWDGNKWKKVPGIAKNFTFFEVTGRSKDEAYTAGKDPDSGEWVLYMYDGIKWKTRALGYSHLTRAGVWQAKSGELFLLGSSNIMIKNGVMQTFVLGNTYIQNSVRGTAVNNIFTVGHGGEIFHFDGVSWKKQIPLPVRVGVTILTKPFVTGNHIFVGSITDFKPLIIRGTRKTN
ncbi:MAG: hypothetical protein HRU80_05670 [Ignavibacteriales bacterium]|nr:MAG: hypothetical protein HRU80_05670 [Ignavibacteriales bacterium]